MQATLYRRPLPANAIAFSSDEGRKIFSEALTDDGLPGYFRLAEQFQTQADPAFCGLGSLTVALNALSIDPGRPWKGPWRWFAEELLDCCATLEDVRKRHEAHHRIFEAIISREPAQAETLMREHVASVKLSIVKSYLRRNSTTRPGAGNGGRGED